MSELKEWTASEIEEYDDARLELAEDGKIDCTRVYIKSEVDATIDELKAENERLKKCEIWMMQHFYCEEVIACESAKNRILKRALWMARASSAKNKVRFFGWSFDCYNTTLLINIDGHKYKMPKQSRMMTCHDWIEIFERVEERCRQKAEEYK